MLASAPPSFSNTTGKWNGKYYLGYIELNQYYWNMEQEVLFRVPRALLKLMEKENGNYYSGYIDFRDTTPK